MFLGSKKSTPPAARSGAPSIISAGLTVTGNLVSDGDIQIDGVVEGDVAAAKLTLGDSARVRGQISADQVLIKGEVTGTVRARQVELAKTAVVRGDIWHELLSIETGAFVEGMCKHAEKPQAAPIKVGALPGPLAGAAPHGDLAEEEEIRQGELAVR